MKKSVIFLTISALAFSALADFSNSSTRVWGQETSYSGSGTDRNQIWSGEPIGATPTANTNPTQVERHITIGNQTAAQQRDSVQDVYGANARVIRTSSESRILSCPAGMTGSITESRQVSTDGNGLVTYGAWSTVSDTCAAVVVVVPLVVPPPPPPVVVPPVVVPPPPPPVVAPPVVVPPPVAPPPADVITTSIENQTIACPAGQTGNIYQSRLITYNNGVISSVGGWNDGGSTCYQLPPPADPMVWTIVFRCGVELARGYVPQSQEANWYATVGADAVWQWDSVNSGVCGVGGF